MTCVETVIPLILSISRLVFLGLSGYSFLVHQFVFHQSKSNGFNALSDISYCCKGIVNLLWCRSQWPRGLRRRSEATRLLRLWVRIPPGAWMSFCCECCVLSGRDLCDELITRPEESYRLWCVVCDLETS